MYIPPKSFLSRLLAAAWTIFLIALLLWFTIRLLAEVWIWIVGFVAVLLLIRIGIWVRQWRRERW